MTTLTAEELEERSLALRDAFPDMPHGGAALLEALIAAAAMEDELSVSEWADRFRYIGAESGSRYPGLWRTSRVPYTRQPMDCLHPDHPARRITLKWSAQTGKSEIGVCRFNADQPLSTIISIT